MPSLTRWVLAHKRTVVLTWIVLTIAGIAAAGPRHGRARAGVLGARQGGLGDQRRDRRALPRHRRRHGSAAARGHAAEGQDVDSPAVQRDLAQLDADLERALPQSRIASYASTGDRAFVSDDGRTTFALVYPQPDPTSDFGENPQAEKAASRALDGADGRRAGRCT